VDQNSSEAPQTLHGDTNAIDAWLKNLWDRTKKAAELISRLREEKADLQTRVTAMEEDLRRLRQELGKDEEMIRTLSAAQGDEGNHSMLANGEREQLKARVKDLLTRLDGYV
jgi:chromosome segregation ATPase